MAYPIDVSDLRQSPHDTVSAADRLRLILFGYRAERIDGVGNVLTTITDGAYGDGLTQGGGIA